jgi:biopolymer transport protein ExbD
MCDINTTPLIDVMLVLLIVFIITIPVLTHAVKLDMPPPLNVPPPEVLPTVINLDVDFDDSIYWDGNKVDINQVEGYFRTESKQDPQPEIHLRPDKRSHYDTTAKVLAVAQRNGMTKIGFVNTTEFSE